MSVAETTPRPVPVIQPAASRQPAPVWRVVVLNDPVNLMGYVVRVFRRVFGFDETRARRHMLEVHEQGRSVLWAGPREPAEAYVQTLQQWQLTARLESDEAT